VDDDSSRYVSLPRVPCSVNRQVVAEFWDHLSVLSWHMLSEFQSSWNGEEPWVGDFWICTFEFPEMYNSRGRRTFLCAYVKGPPWALVIKMVITLPGEEPAMDSVAVPKSLVSVLIGVVGVSTERPDFFPAYIMIFMDDRTLYKQQVCGWVDSVFL
jgi:hypothetical protein